MQFFNYINCKTVDLIVGSERPVSNHVPVGAVSFLLNAVRVGMKQSFYFPRIEFSLNLEYGWF